MPLARLFKTALFVLILAAWPLAATATGESEPASYEIQLLTRRWTPPGALSTNEIWRLQQRATALGALRAGRIHVLLQLRRGGELADREALRRRGIDFGSYVPRSAWIASLPTDRVSEIALLDEVRWMTHWDASFKLHPRIEAGEWGSWAIDPSREGWVRVFVQLHHDVPLDRVQKLAEGHGGEASQPVEGLHGALVRLPKERIGSLADDEDVLWIEPAPLPLSATNDGVRGSMGVNAVQAAPFGLDGAGVRLFVFDGGTIRPTHTTFDAGTGSRVTVLDSASTADHPTHVGGTAAGDGNGGRGKGVAPAAAVLSAGVQGSLSPGDIPFLDVALDIEGDYASARALGADLGNNSIGSNLASNGHPCENEGDYGVSSQLLDGIVGGDNPAVGSPVLMAWANGNERRGGSPRGRCGANYVTTAPPSCAKNPIHVGAINSDGGSMTEFSSWGPCDDGRLKPIVVAPGCEVGDASGETYIHSSLAIDPLSGLPSDTAFGGPTWCGTSMASPAVAGVIALFLQDWRAQGHGGAADRPLPALVKALLVQTANDLGPPGPDYIYGYGAVDAVELIELLRGGGALGGAGTAGWGEEAVANLEVDTFTVQVPPATLELRATVAWDDEAAAAFAATALVNDLDLEVEAPDGTLHSPWVLDPTAPYAPATTGVNSRDNQEQVVVGFPAPGTWTIRVRGATVPMGPQTYGLTFSSQPLTFDPLLCADLVTNGGFETDTSGWTLTGAAREPSPAPGHGAHSLRLGGTTSSEQSASLELSVPSDSPRAEASFWWYMTTTEGFFGHGFDFFRLNLLDAAGGVLETLDFRSDGWQQGQWMEALNLDLAPWAGQTVRLRLEAANDAVLGTTFFVDDVRLEACPTGACLSEEVTNLTVAAGQVVTRVACDVLTAGPAVVVEAGGDLTLQAGSKIVLRSGFRVESGGTLKLVTN